MSNTLHFKKLSEPKLYLFIYFILKFWLHGVFILTRGFSLVVVHGWGGKGASLIEPTSPALEGRFLTTGSPGKSPHCSFDLHFSNNYQCLASLPVLFGHLYVFFGEMSIQVFHRWAFSFSFPGLG